MASKPSSISCSSPSVQSDHVSTPSRDGSSSVVEGLSSSSVTEVDARLLLNIQRHQTCSFRDASKEFLRRCHTDTAKCGPDANMGDGSDLDKEMDAILDRVLAAVLPLYDNEIREHLDEYCNILLRENGRIDKRKRYTPMTLAFNKALQALAAVELEPLRAVETDEMDRILFHRNDPGRIKGTRGQRDAGTERVPNFTIARGAQAKRVGHEDNRDYTWEDIAFGSATAQPNQSFTLGDTLSTVEVKARKQALPRLPSSFSASVSVPEVPPIPCSVGKRETPPPGVLSDHAPDDQRTTGDASSSVRLPPAAERVADASVVVAGQCPPNPSQRTGKRAAAFAPPGGLKKARTTRIVVDQAPEDRIPLAKGEHMLVQMTSYATKMLNQSFVRTHFIELVVLDDVVHILWYDRQGIIQSAGLNFVQDFPHFMALLFAFQRFEDRDWGIGDFIQPVSLSEENAGRHGRCNLATYSAIIDTARPRIQRCFPSGRATVVLDVLRCSKLETGAPFEQYSTVLKIQWAECSRMAEAAIIDEAHTRAQAASNATYRTFVKEHISTVTDRTEYTEFNTALIRRNVKAKERPGVSSSQPRQLRIMLLRRLEPISHLQGDELLRAFWDCYHCHYFVWCAGIHHRDVSVSNLMFFRDKGGVHGVLNDFDLASRETEDAPPSDNERIGTVPFMAQGLLSNYGGRGKLRHIYRFDNESFAWVALWIGARFEDGKEDYNELVTRSWHGAGCLGSKSTYLDMTTAITLKETHTARVKDCFSEIKDGFADFEFFWRRTKDATVEPTRATVYKHLVESDPEELVRVQGLWTACDLDPIPPLI